MTTLEDKILGETDHCYCSSSESDGEDSAEGETKGATASTTKQLSDVSPPDPYKWEGSSTNTGPKGVVNDWQRFKHKLSLTCKSVLDEEKDDNDLDKLLNDDFLLEYQKKRMEEMMSQLNSLPKFGKVVDLKDTQEFLDAVDKENKSVLIVVHIYEKNAPGCNAMNGCLTVLSQEYTQVKFCRLVASVAGVSKHFKISGVPALLLYKGGALVGNFVRMSEELGTDFFAEDVESFLLEHGMLPDKTCIPPIIRSSQQDDEDSDLSLE
ncbi:unnamed protein product [Timema podura]|uniref:Phosducin domain-containing protein n=1 Tax=Timema podura TaxID=61482 RepID=A0ABN7PKV3_TIMPD|nr:unnamed protein product [Timema podura]